MSASQKTSHYELPIYAGSDITGWLSGFNPAMQAIDTALFNINQTAEDANGTAVGAEADAQTAITSAQNTANLLAETNVKVNTLINKLTFHKVNFETLTTGASVNGESNGDNSITLIRCNVSGTPASSYTVNNIPFYEFGSCDEKLTSNIMNGSVNTGFTGTEKIIGNIALKTANNRVVTLKVFYDNSAKKTRIGTESNNAISVNDSTTSCANIVFTNILSN